MNSSIIILFSIINFFIIINFSKLKFINVNLDKPDKTRKFHLKNIPRAGGLLIIFNLIIYFFIINFNHSYLENEFFFKDSTEFNYFFISAELIISLLISTLIILSYFLISKVTGAQLSLIDIGIMMPLIAIIGILPLGLGNLGGLQVGTLLVFQFISEKSTEIILMSLIFILITILVNSIFGIIFLKSSFSIFKQTLLNYEKKL